MYKVHIWYIYEVVIGPARSRAKVRVRLGPGPVHEFIYIFQRIVKVCTSFQTNIHVNIRIVPKFLYKTVPQEPVTIQLGSELTSEPRGTIREQDTFQYVPLQEGLKALLKNQHVFDEVSLIQCMKIDLMSNLLSFS